jgi:DNA (cytosine-5)-methyltransferase 1
MPTFGSLFSGIGGLDLGLERAGWECKWQVEIDEWCRRVLARHWPDVPRWEDAKTFPPDAERDGWIEASRDTRGMGRTEAAEEGGQPESGRTPSTLDGSSLGVDLIVGGFPCQPVSLAGKRRGQDDERWLWSEFARIVRLLRPRFVLVENVPGLLARGMGDVLGDLAASGYDTEWDCIPAAALGAPHLRYRVFIVAYRDGGGLEGERSSGLLDRERSTLGDDANGRRGAMAYAEGDGGHGRSWSSGTERWTGLEDGGDVAGAVGDGGQRRWVFGESPSRSGSPRSAKGSDQGVGWWTTEPDVGRVAHGVPARVDRLRGLGNAVVPQVAEWIGRRLMEATA